MNKPEHDTLSVPIEDIPLPPEELREQLENTPDNGADHGKENDTPDVEIESLEFISPEDERQTEVTLKHPFKWGGEAVTAIRVRRLTVAEVGRLASRARGGDLDFYAIYSEMTGMPAPVLRGLIDDDGQAVADACTDFFPHAFRPASE